MTLTLFIIVVTLAFVFGLTNGFIDGGGLVSTVITTRALEPLQALILVATGEILGLFLLGSAVARTLAQRMVVFPNLASPYSVMAVLASALVGALIWNTSMWRMALPSSSSHALVGGIVGAFLTAYGARAIVWPVFVKIFLFLGIVPLLAALVGYFLSLASYRIGEYLTPSASHFFRFLQVLGLAGTAMVHGSNDGQKSLAMMYLGLFAFMGLRQTNTPYPWQILLLCGGALALGIVFGSRRIIRTLGKRLYRVEELQGSCAGLSTLFLVGGSSLLGYPMSTTHVMSTSIIGAGVAIHPRAVRWGLAAEIGLVWLVTIPSSAALASGIMWITRHVGMGL